MSEFFLSTVAKVLLIVGTVGFLSTNFKVLTFSEIIYIVILRYTYELNWILHWQIDPWSLHCDHSLFPVVCRS